MHKFNVKQLEQYIDISRFTREKHPDADLFIYGYDNRKSGSPIVWDSINTHLRGIILDSKGNVINRSFKKFHTFKNYITKNTIALTEGQNLLLPDCKYKIYEKVDGSMAILYWIGDIPHLASQRSFTSLNALKATEILHKKYSHLFNKLNKKNTYIFEVIYPETEVIVKYKQTEDLMLIGIIDNKTAVELPVIDIGFPMAKDFTNEYEHISDLEELANLNLPNIEGFVLHYDNGIKIKLKFPWFSEAKKLQTNILVNGRIVYESKLKLSKLTGIPIKKVSNYTVWEHLKSGKPIESILMNIPEEFYTFGFEHWFIDTCNSLEREFNLYKKNALNILDTDKIWEEVKPKELDIFDPEKRNGNPKYCATMWNLMKRVNNSFL